MGWMSERRALQRITHSTLVSIQDFRCQKYSMLKEGTWKENGKRTSRKVKVIAGYSAR